MNKAIFCLLAAPALASAQIYRCDTPRGPVFSDERCGEEASLVTVTDESAGLGGGPPEEVREYLARKRQERAEQRRQNPALPSPRRDATDQERIRELEQQRTQYVTTPSYDAAEIARLQRRIAELKAARNTGEESPDTHVLRLDRDE